MSISQLRALEVLIGSKSGVIEAYDTEKVLGLEGKALGGVFSSLSRQVVNNQSLVLPWGRSRAGRGLKWKLNDAVIDKDKLIEVIKEILR